MEKYTHLEIIGEGSFGQAVLVQCKSSKAKFVIKEIQLPKNQDKRQDSKREAVLLSKMKHPNIVAFREAFETDDDLCIVMEYCSGGDLLQRIQQQKSKNFCTEMILKWFAQMCAGAQHIHEKRVLHRDLKSKNIFLTGDGAVKLGDFGSACVLRSAEAHAHAYIGTPYYVAPEIWDNKPYNNKSDVWSLGCVLYELCTLRHPFQASSWKSLILKVCRGAYPALPGHLRYELHHLIRQMFKTNPKDRPSVHTILSSHRISKLLRSHLPPQLLEDNENTHTEWNTKEGKQVAEFLANKSLLQTSTFKGGLRISSDRSESEKPKPRKQWTEPTDTLLRALAGARLLSSDSEASLTLRPSSSTCESEEPKDGQRRKQWDRVPPQRLLSLLEKAELNKNFSTFVIRRAGEDPLVGPLSRAQGDESDGLEQEIEVDEDRGCPRSDDEDTDFEEESPCDWMNEVEKMLEQ